MQVDTHLTAIINYEKIQHESSKELRNFIDCVNKNLRALKVLKYEQNNLSDAFLINIILQKLDRETRKLFEYTTKKTEYPKFTDLMSFLENRSSTLESVNQCLSIKPSNKHSPYSNKSKTFMLNSNDKTNQKPCALCKNVHALNKCSKFLSMNNSERYEFVKQNRLCFNCLKNHSVKVCSSKYNCFYCPLRHNSLLHRREGENEERIKPQIETIGATPLYDSSAVLTSKDIQSSPDSSETKHFQTLSSMIKEKKICIIKHMLYFH